MSNVRQIFPNKLFEFLADILSQTTHVVKKSAFLAARGIGRVNNKAYKLSSPQVQLIRNLLQIPSLLLLLAFLDALGLPVGIKKKERHGMTLLNPSHV